MSSFSKALIVLPVQMSPAVGSPVRINLGQLIYSKTHRWGCAMFPASKTVFISAELPEKLCPFCSLMGTHLHGPSRGLDVTFVRSVEDEQTLSEITVSETSYRTHRRIPSGLFTNHHRAVPTQTSFPKTPTTCWVVYLVKLWCTSKTARKPRTLVL